LGLQQVRHGRDLGKTVALRLQPVRLEAVDVKALALVLIAVAMLAFGAGHILTPHPVTASRLLPPVAAAARDSAIVEPLDAYGNEVTNAVAEYTLDPTGSLYELHSPQIELPHLGSPKS
jgi:hypothetical protein